jgi:ElaB/YqjD/DUF883 family membrane-anchored ribosome-binding protein
MIVPVSRNVEARNIMARNLLRSSRSATARDMAEIGRLLHDLEGRLGHLAKSVVADGRQAGSAVPDMIAETFSDIADRVRDSIRDSARTVGQEATRFGGGAWRTLEHEITERPLMALAVAAGIGFLVGVLNRR